MKKYFPTLICLLFLSISGMAQTQTMIDSLKSVLPNLSGEDKVKALRDLCYNHASINFEDAVKYGERAIFYATEIGSKNELGASYKSLGIVYSISGRHETALNFFEKALNLFKVVGDQKNEAFMLNNLGIIHLDKSNFPTALNYLFKSLEMKTSLGGVKISNTLNNIGEVYRSKKDYEKALEYYSQALDAAEKDKDQTGIGNALNNMAIVYRDRGDYEKALMFRMQEIEMQKKAQDSLSLAVSYNNLGELYTVQNKLEKAQQLFNQSMEIVERLNNMPGMAHSSLGLARLYAKIGDFQKAIAFAEKSMSLAKAMGDRHNQLIVYLSLSQIHQKFGKNEKALLYHIDYTALKDSLFNTTKETLISDMETKYQTSKKETENAVLKLETEQQLATIAQKNQQVALFIISLLILVILAGLLFRAYRQKNKNNKVLVTQKEELIKLNATKNRFFGIIAHDLRGPLTALQGISGLLNYNIKKGDTSSLNKIALQIEDSAQKVNTLLDNLLKWALSQEGAMPHQPQQLALKPLIDESLHYFKDMAAAKEIRLTADVSNEVHVHADKETLSTVFRNLINNSIKFTPHGGSVSLLAVSKQDEVQINVQDNGAGIDEKKLEKLFVLDDNKSTSGTDAEKGTGLGLVLVNDFVHMNRGTIEIESKPNQGSIFSITLPTAYAKAG